jgi:hypothetical protein
VGGVDERCEEGCEFAWSSIAASDVSERIIKSSTEMADLLLAGANSAARKSSEVWSPLEYASHVRDVLFNLRDRLVVALNEENPLCKGLFGTPRIELGLYAGDSIDVVCQELKMAASLFTRTWDRIPEGLRGRTMVYGYPRLADRSLRWVAAQALHEVEHHLADVRVGLAES